MDWGVHALPRTTVAAASSPAVDPRLSRSRRAGTPQPRAPWRTVRLSRGSPSWAIRPAQARRSRSRTARDPVHHVTTVVTHAGPAPSSDTARQRFHPRREAITTRNSTTRSCDTSAKSVRSGEGAANGATSGRFDERAARMSALHWLPNSWWRIGIAGFIFSIWI